MRINNIYLVVIFIVLIGIVFFGCEETSDEVVPVITLGAVTDVDGNVYVTAKIGNQNWMAENLRAIHYSNGDPITITDNETSNAEWTQITSEAGCYVSNNASSVNQYGILYNWYAATDARNIAPEGWHVPTDDDWKTLESYLGMPDEDLDGSNHRGSNEGRKLKSATDWSGWSLQDSSEFVGTDEWGFSAKPTPYRYGTNGYFYSMSSMGDLVNYWTSTTYNSSEAISRSLYWGEVDIDRDIEDKRSGFSIRCVKN